MQDTKETRTINSISFLFLKLFVRETVKFSRLRTKTAAGYLFYNSSFFYRTLGLHFDGRAAAFAVSRSFDFFVNAGRCDARILTIAPKPLIVDEAALNAYVLAATTAAEVLDLLSISQSVKTADKLLSELELNDFDAIFVIDMSLSMHAFTTIAKSRCFVFGANTRKNAYSFVDFILPFEAAAPAIQYFIIELAFFGIGFGRKQKLLAVGNKVCVLHKKLASL